jgi:hypothetical protein
MKLLHTISKFHERYTTIRNTKSYGHISIILKIIPSVFCLLVENTVQNTVKKYNELM